MNRLFNADDQQGLLALAPFLLLATSFSIALTLSLLLAAFLCLQVLLLFVCRLFIPARQRLAISLILGVTLALIADLHLAAHAPVVLELVPVLLPLMVINSLVLSHSEAVFASVNHQQLWRGLMRTALVIVGFFALFGGIQTILPDLPIMALPAGCFLLVGILFALINALQRLTRSIDQ